MKLSYTISSLFLLLPLTFALPLLSENTVEAARHQTIPAKRQHDGSANNILVPSIDSNKDVHDLELNRRAGAPNRYYEDGPSGNRQKRQATTGYEKLEPACPPQPHKSKLQHRPNKQEFHHGPNKQKVGGGVTNDNQTNSPAHAQSNSTVMPAAAPQPMAGSSTSQAPPPAAGTIPDPNYGGPPHADLPSRQLAGRHAPPAPEPHDAMSKRTPTYESKSYQAAPVPAPVPAPTYIWWRRPTYLCQLLTIAQNSTAPQANRN